MALYRTHKIQIKILCHKTGVLGEQRKNVYLFHDDPKSNQTVTDVSQNSVESTQDTVLWKLDTVKLLHVSKR